MNKDRIQYLQSRIPKEREKDIEDKYRKQFERGAQYMGNGVYNWMGISATSPAEVYLLGVLRSENIEFDEI